MSRRTGRTMREERRTYRIHRCAYVEATGARCHSAPAVGSTYCLLHEPPEIGAYCPDAECFDPGCPDARSSTLEDGS